jgi:hypothetical protein
MPFALSHFIFFDPNQTSASNIFCAAQVPGASKISGNKIIRAPAPANVDPGRGGAYQITIAVERVQKAQLIGARIWLNSSQRIFAYKK